MKNSIKKAELLAPAGDWDSLVAAVNAGADAVYLAGQAYGARAYAKNFSKEELLKAIDYLHLFDKKIYLTINTLNKNMELETLPEFLAPFYDRGLDGVIVQDLGVIRLLKNNFPGLSLHASTQMTVTGAMGAQFLQEYGLERVVPARELSLKELIEIKNTGIEVEAFIHGAMCYCYSGQCLMSSVLGGRSGNRGRCAGPCRLPFTSYEGIKLLENKSYILSLKDLCTIENISEILDAGIDSLKIEGRMKSPEYVAYVTSLYRKYIDRFYSGKDTRVEKQDLDTLRKLFIRGDISNGYLHRRNSKDMITLSKPGYNGSDDKLMKELHENYVVSPKEYDVNINAYVSCGENLRIIVSDGETSGESVGNIVEESINRPADQESISQKLVKLGGTNLKANEVDVYINGSCFVNIKELNECRRQAVDAFKNNKLEKYNRASNSKKYENSECLSTIKETELLEKKTLVLSVLVRTKKQLETMLEWDFNIRVCIEADLLLDLMEANEIEIVKKISKNHDFYIALPRICRLSDNKFLDKIYHCLIYINSIDGIIIRNLEELAWIDNIRKTDELRALKLISDYNLYAFNNQSIEFYKEFNLEVTLPLELNKSELIQLKTGGTELVVYGRIPLMVTAGCLQNTLEGCDKKSGFRKVSDRTNTEFLIYKDCRRCENVIYNSIPTSLHQFSNSIDRLNLSAIRLEFTNESPEEMAKVMSTTCKAFDLNVDYNFYPEDDTFRFTKGYFKRGVE